MKRKTSNKQIVIYQSPDGALELKADAGKETVWATQSQIAGIFANVQIMHIAN